MLRVSKQTAERKKKENKKRIVCRHFLLGVCVCVFVCECLRADHFLSTLADFLLLLLPTFCFHFPCFFPCFFCVCVLCSSTKFIIAVLLLSFLITSIIHFWDGPMRMSRCKRQKKRRTLSRFTFLNVFSSLMTEDIAKSYESTMKSIFSNHDGFLHRHLKISVL